ncbi:protein kinase domain-containing protein [Sorangium sp. So ce131]|uniref:serine/threonine-protein kinase n=1 Tax=Sorangium sp. So ce131 TaxID=3133282 RepID=UPI003F62DB96
MRREPILAGRYSLERLAGSGGMGKVWKALDRETGEAVAVKVLSGGQLDDAARFAREVQILADLSHPRVVRHVAHGASAEGAPYLVMEWLDGEDLAARLARGPLSVDESVALAVCVADVLAYAHARGVIHRDLKPSNLFLPGGRLDEVKVLDFGIARVGHATRMTRSGILLGTPGYMAPEQARGEASIDARADVFSLGCVLFECLTGEPAFGGQHMMAVLAKVLIEETPSARSVRPEVPEPLDALVRRMLSKGREERPLDAEEAAAALRALKDVPSKSTGKSSRAPSLTGGEQRTVAVILVSAAQAEAAPFDGASTLAAAPEDAAILREAAAYGGVSERLLDGSVVVIMAGAGPATDLCAQAARCALSLRAHAGGRRVTLALGRGERRGRSFGPAIDRVARLSETRARDGAPEGVVVIDEAAAGLLDARFEVHEEEGCFGLRGERALDDGARLLLGRATPCVGRDRELGMLRALFAEAVEDGAAQAALVVAPPGMGKSRLGRELVQELRGRGEPLSIWVARGDALRAGSPLGMLGQALRSACGIREGEPLEVRRERLSAQVAAWVTPGEQRRVAEFLGEIIGAPFPEDEDSLPLQAARRDAQLMADQVRAAFLDFLEGACEEAPVLVLLDDLHWGDKISVQLLDAALRSLEERPLLVVALARPEVHDLFPRLWSERRLHEMRLVELSRRAGERLARHVLGEGADAEVIGRIVRLSEGNAFYLEELIRWTAEGRGADMPETVVAMVESRLAALDEGARRLLRAASVFGEVCWAGGVTTLLGGESHRSGVIAGFGALVERELLVRRRESRFPGEEELAFRHALLRESAYAMLTERDRTLGHWLAGEWLEARGEQDARVLAEHFEKGGDGSSAGKYYLRAAQQASWGGDGLEQASLARRGLALSLPGELRIRLLGALCEAAMWQPHLAASMQREAEELMQAAPRGTTPWLQGVAARLSGAAVTGKTEEMLAVARALEQADIVPDAVYPAAVTLVLTMYLLESLGCYPDVEALYAKSDVLRRAVGDRSVAAMCVLLIGTADRAAKKGDPVGMLEHAKRGCELARQCGHRRMESIGSLGVAMGVWCLGAPDEAERMLTSLPISDTEFGPVSAYRPFVMAWMLAERGALAEARAYADHLALTLGRARGLPLDEGRGRWVLAEVLRRAGALEEAEREVDSALRLLGTTCLTDVSGVLATKAALRLAQGRPGEALAAAEEGLSRQAAMGLHDRFFRGGSFLRLVHAESLVATGRHDEARAAVARARDRIFSIAAKISDDVYRTSFLENVPENRRILELAREWLGEHVA